MATFTPFGYIGHSPCFGARKLTKKEINDYCTRTGVEPDKVDPELTLKRKEKIWRTSSLKISEKVVEKKDTQKTSCYGMVITKFSSKEAAKKYLSDKKRVQGWPSTVDNQKDLNGAYAKEAEVDYHKPLVSKGQVAESERGDSKVSFLLFNSQKSIYEVLTYIVKGAREAGTLTFNVVKNIDNTKDKNNV